MGIILNLMSVLLTLSVVRAYQYCVIGAGPGGVQIGYFLHKSNRDYIILERSDKAGSFFEMYPRHRKLISINKRHTGSTNKEFNLRHDWNSLLSDDDQILFKEFSKEMFPPADSYVRYINTFVKHFNLRILYNTEIKTVREIDSQWFDVRDQNNQTKHCKIVIVGTGVSQPNIPNITGIELTDGYETISTNGSDFEGKSVLILGRGNSAFETAQSIYDRTNYVHMIGRQRIRLAWETHYVGDIRAVNNEILDTYQLKSLDGFLEYGDIQQYKIVRMTDGLYLKADNKIVRRTDGLYLKDDDNKIVRRTDGLYLKDDDNDVRRTDGLYLKDDDNKIVRRTDGLYLKDDDNDAAEIWGEFENDPLQKPYDRIIRCLGFHFDTSIYLNRLSDGYKGKYPALTADYQSVEIPGLYVVGTAAHSLDHRKSAGGFIHGFRYTARALHRILSVRFHEELWPHANYSISELLPVTVKRINEASGIYQMFGQLADVVLLNSETFQYFEEFPVKLIHKFDTISGVLTLGKAMIVILLQYGKDYHGPLEDVFREDRAATEPRYAHLSNFLHPVLYFYHNPPKEWNDTNEGNILPRPDRLLHLVEDFHTNWRHNQTHVQHLKTFLENCISQRLDAVRYDECLQYALSRTTIPITCHKY